MPIVAVNLSQSLFTEVSRLVEQGLYASPEQLLEIAAFNQVALERGASPGEAVTRGAGAKSGRRNPTELRERRQVRTKDNAHARKAARTSKTRRTGRGVSVSNEEVASTLGRAERTALAHLPTPLRAAQRPLNERVWGQVNRLFPVKFACRLVAAANRGQEKWIAYDTFIDRLGEDAAIIGSMLEALDLSSQRKREGLLSIGLPRRGNSASRDRFVTQFVARTTRSGEIYPGAICQFALADFDGERLALTERGVELAHLENPILDRDAAKATQTLANSEREFLVEQVRLFVVGELQDFRAVVRGIRAEANTPETLLAALRVSLPSEWSDLMVRTQVAGVVARMTDLGLLARRWQGRHVSYSLTPYLDSLRDFGEEP
jgi:hypothetical protein